MTSAALSLIMVMAVSGCEPETVAGTADTTAGSADTGASSADTSVSTADTATAHEDGASSDAPSAPVVGCGPPPSTPWSFRDAAKDGPFLAGYLDVSLRDPTRKTAARGLLPESNSRTLDTRIWYPAKRGLLGDLTPKLWARLDRDAGPFPLIVHSHGFSSNKDELAYAAEYLASRGYVVVAATFPLTNLMTIGGPQIEDVINQPGDVSFLIDELIGRSMTSSNMLYGAVDPERIAVSGVSLGGMTTLLTSYHRDLRDPRVKRAINIAGPSAWFTEQFYQYADVPLMILHGDIDAMVDYEANALAALDRAGSGTQLLTFINASHAAFAGAVALLPGDNPDVTSCGFVSDSLMSGGDPVAELLDEEAGVVQVPFEAPCDIEGLPDAMETSRQHKLTRVALYAYLEAGFAADAGQRAAACHFLSEVLPEQDDVTWQIAD